MLNHVKGKAIMYLLLIYVLYHANHGHGKWG
jgi:hypothetical protein